MHVNNFVVILNFNLQSTLLSNTHFKHVLRISTIEFKVTQLCV